MSASEVFGLGERAMARRSDCETSHEAAESVKNISDLQDFILGCFWSWGPMTDEQLWEALTPTGLRAEVVGGFSLKGIVTPSGLRSRRSELVAKGLLEFSGGFGETKSGRRARIWRVVR